MRPKLEAFHRETLWTAIFQYNLRTTKLERFSVVCKLSSFVLQNTSKTKLCKKCMLFSLYFMKKELLQMYAHESRLKSHTDIINSWDSSAVFSSHHHSLQSSLAPIKKLLLSIPTFPHIYIYIHQYMLLVVSKANHQLLAKVICLLSLDLPTIIFHCKKISMVCFFLHSYRWLFGGSITPFIVLLKQIRTYVVLLTCCFDEPILLIQRCLISL